MEDVLEVYRRPYDPRQPQICIDETSKQLLEHTREPIAVRPGAPAREDDEYKRKRDSEHLSLRGTADRKDGR